MTPFSSRSLIPYPVAKPLEEHLNKGRRFQGIPGIARISSGRLFAVWYTGGSTECGVNYVVMAISDDDGRTWSDTVAVIDPPDLIRTFDSTLWVSPDGRLYWFYAQCSGGEDGKWQNSDGIHGVWHVILNNPDAADPADFTFTDPVRISNGVMMNKPVVLSDGVWALPVSEWSLDEKNIPQIESLNPSPGCKMIVSEDGGRTFHERGSITVRHIPGGPSFDEHSFVECADGSIRAFIRVARGTADAFSYDRGVTWTAPRLLTNIQTPSSRIFVRRLASGRLLLVANDVSACGNKQSRTNLTAYLSEDDGETWKYSLLLDDRTDISYPDGTEAENGFIYLVYDHDRTGDGQILLAKFTEADIMAGRLAAEGSRLRQEISRIRRP